MFHVFEKIKKDEKGVVACNVCGVKLKVQNDGSTYICPVCGNKFRLHAKNEPKAQQKPAQKPAQK